MYTNLDWTKPLLLKGSITVSISIENSPFLSVNVFLPNASRGSTLTPSNGLEVILSYILPCILNFLISGIYSFNLSVKALLVSGDLKVDVTVYNWFTSKFIPIVFLPASVFI